MIFNALLLLAFQAQTPAPEPDWLVAVPDYRWSFPADHWAHEGYRTEWWYLTGHLAVAPDSAPRFGYQFTFFKIGLSTAAPDSTSDWAAANLIMGHAALTDLATGRHTFSELLYRDAGILGSFGRYPDSTIVWSLAPPGTAGTWSLRWNGTGFDVTMSDAAAGFGFSLATAAGKPPAFQGPNGYSSKGGPGSASQYYSLTRMQTTGTVTNGDSILAVTGSSWMDKEFGSNQLSDSQTGWDWFSVQLFDGRELMLYRIRGEPEHFQATVVGETGAATVVAPGTWSLAELDRWTSGRTGATYPSRWRITLPDFGLQLTASPLLAAQENVSRLVPGLYYWEGVIDLHDESGRQVGIGYAELTGYGHGSRPAL